MATGSTGRGRNARGGRGTRGARARGNAATNPRRRPRQPSTSGSDTAGSGQDSDANPPPRKITKTEAWKRALGPNSASKQMRALQIAFIQEHGIENMSHPDYVRHGLERYVYIHFAN